MTDSKKCEAYVVQRCSDVTCAGLSVHQLFRHFTYLYLCTCLSRCLPVCFVVVVVPALLSTPRTLWSSLWPSSTTRHALQQRTAWCRAQFLSPVTLRMTSARWCAAQCWAAIPAAAMRTATRPSARQTAARALLMAKPAPYLPSVCRHPTARHPTTSVSKSWTQAYVANQITPNRSIKDNINNKRC